jgi:hypothetical protein
MSYHEKMFAELSALVSELVAALKPLSRDSRSITKKSAAKAAIANARRLV